MEQNLKYILTYKTRNENAVLKKSPMLIGNITIITTVFLIYLTPCLLKKIVGRICIYRIKQIIESFVLRHHLSKWETICSYWLKHNLANRDSLWIIMLCISIAIGLSSSSRSKNSGVCAIFIQIMRQSTLNAYLSQSFVMSYYHYLWVLLNIK